MGRTSAQQGGQGPGDGQDQWVGPHGVVPTNDKPADIKANPDYSAATTSQREQGEETYIEVRGPASLGQRSRTPYFRVLPSYQKKAEQAIDRQKVPKSHQKRVRAYFDSLQRGK